MPLPRAARTNAAFRGALRAAGLLAVAFLSCAAATADSSRQALVFGVTWPPSDLRKPLPTNATRLLDGLLQTEVRQVEGRTALKLSITLSRRASEADRVAWNKALAFPQYDWMRYVRAWDTNQQWLWPNLPYLLRAPGQERVERYGGWDPGKAVDNDFAAVLIRKATPDTNAGPRERPLVSAEWHPPAGVSNANPHTILHEAQSDEFTVTLPREPQPGSGLLQVWLVYADFMGAPLPPTWPREPEWAGGILAYFEVDWRLTTPDSVRVALKQSAPPRATGFDWEHWVARSRQFEPVRAVPRLSDR